MIWSSFKQDSRFIFNHIKARNMTHSNALISEKSPYLLQHASNPVDWHPWGEEAFKLAKTHNKLIFLSVGYSTCHWCHVMEKESFENEEVAKIMNKNFINIKVDREERPDVDKLYMTFVQATTGGGGWPMSVWLTPDLKPIFGGTYFPPEEKGHQIGFKTILESIADKWKHSMVEMRDSSENFMKAIKQSVSSDISSISRAQELQSSKLPDVAKVMEKCFEKYCRRFDPTNGGFSRAPKFPQPVIMDFLFAYHKFHKGNDKGDRALDMISITLKKMSLGGVYDQLGNGFHRYSVDGHWFLPHFEKMLYDQAQLVTTYGRAFNQTGDLGLGDVAHRIISYLKTDMANKANGGGGFFSAEDADSLPTKDSQHKNEGAFYVWDWVEIKQILANIPLPPSLINKNVGTSADLFACCYGVKPDGNVDPAYDPHHELGGMNVLALHEELEALADKYGAPRDEFTQWLESCKVQLLAERSKRPRPSRDDKILACWNGLMISALVHASLYLDNQDYLKLAENSAQFVKDNMCVDGHLLRSVYYDAKTHQIQQLNKPIAGFVDDYAFVVQAMLDLYEVSREEKWLVWARELQDAQNDLFWDKESGGYFISSHSDSSLVMRMKEEQDGAEPSGNSISASNLIRLSTILGEESYLKLAEKIFEAYSYAIVDYPSAVPRLLSAYRTFTSPTSQAIIYGAKEDQEVKQFVKCLYGNVNGIISVYPGYDGILKDKDEIKNILGEKRDKPTVYLCENNVCSLPIESVSELKDKLAGKI